MNSQPPDSAPNNKPAAKCSQCGHRFRLDIPAGVTHPFFSPDGMVLVCMRCLETYQAKIKLTYTPKT